MIIGKIMSKAIYVIEPEDSLSNVITLMNNNRCSCVLVSIQDTLVGIITERDVVGMLAGSVSKKSFEHISVYEVMTKDPICVQEKTTLPDALTLARNHRLRHFPVVNDNEKLIGLVTQTDIMNTYMELFEKQTQLEDVVKELQSLTLEDALLGIGNRRAMEADLAFNEASAKRYQKYYAVALLDVDYFKKYNDHYGHQAGDKALQAITQAIKSVKRDSDRLYRYGGEELLLIMPNTDRDGAKIAAERLRQAVEAMQHIHNESPLAYLTVSIGTASDQAGEWEALVKSADEALYAAKNGGRNMVCSANKNRCPQTMAS